MDSNKDKELNLISRIIERFYLLRKLGYIDDLFFGVTIKFLFDYMYCENIHQKIELKQNSASDFRNISWCLKNEQNYITGQLPF